MEYFTRLTLKTYNFITYEQIAVIKVKKSLRNEIKNERKVTEWFYGRAIVIKVTTKADSLVHTS